MANRSENNVRRRDFLRALALSPLAMATTQGKEAQAASESREERTRSLYRKTEHVKTYYRVNRYPGRGE
ncbi:formate dehydrogenase [Mesorhizobium soli]|uniref:Formate dehydrogenase n=1 Tax=Pseudaminobacter soli (ex Li et al. 2025) TaxID=1295366 RepID=A0A2P7SL43_9HYPH|nr:formate dehydrogenase [Mesorhizobium soli]